MSKHYTVNECICSYDGKDLFGWSHTDIEQDLKGCPILTGVRLTILIMGSLTFSHQPQREFL